MKGVCVLLFVVVWVMCVTGQHSNMPPPFTRQLYFAHPEFVGHDVKILQALLNRSEAVSPKFPTFSSSFDAFTERALKQFQTRHSFNNNGVLSSNVAQLLLARHIPDGYRDNGKVPAGFKYKVHVPVHRNRSIETQATLYDGNGRKLFSFTARTHGQNFANGEAMNELTGSGSTPTGLGLFDLNSPEDDPKSYGKWPVNRIVQGLEGNMKLLIQNSTNEMIRDGILMHTGEWSGWNPSLPMPNSHGCVHTHPEDCRHVYLTLVNDLHVAIRTNTGGRLPYPYPCQGIISIELVD
eukprot:TRINITY_DN1862_c0_g1_i1.p1 TRINITY_DN1862_c0_g1~~TRINITY_DN1862_c0_g1_i1.p1  ORF type:complete len:294 (-),score=42.73 TRINITY_DN1862_c0_g1_i1:24-905(-)